jgi:hypothetical protein
MSAESKIEVCEPWPFHDHDFPDRNYTAWWGKCSECGSKVVVTNRVHRLIEERADAVRLMCVQCSDRLTISN